MQVKSRIDSPQINFVIQNKDVIKCILKKIAQDEMKAKNNILQALFD